MEAQRKLTFFKKQIPFISSLKKRILVGAILGFLLAFIIIFLEPFDTNNYESNYKTLSLSGFGLLFFIVFLIHSKIENIIYYGFDKIWKVSYEVISVLFFFLVLGTIIFLYNHLIINSQNYSIKSHLWYYKNIVIVFLPIFFPLLIYLRNKFGELIAALPENTITLLGENKNEVLQLQKKDLLYIKALENYIEICFIDSHNTISIKTFRQTLSKTSQQAPFLEKCHRSYLINITNIQDIIGNSQNAKISFKNIDETIPLSKTFFTKIKNSVLLK